MLPGTAVYLSAAAEATPDSGTVSVWNLVAYLAERLGEDSPARPFLIFAGAFFCILLPYLIGSISPAILISKGRYGRDVREAGDRVAEAHEMLRQFGPKPATATLLCDLVKTAAAVWTGILIFGIDGAALAGFFAVFGHLFPVYHKFRGGNGMVCLFAVALCTNWITGVILFGVFLILLFGTRFLALATAVTAMIYPLVLRAFTGENAGLTVAMAVLTMLFVIIRHKDNLSRIFHGKEPKIRFSRDGEGKK